MINIVGNKCDQDLAYHNLKMHFRKGINMEKQTFNIPNISCGHCTMSIENELKDIDGISDVQSNVAEKTVTVQWQAPVTHKKILDTLKEINYPVA